MSRTTKPLTLAFCAALVALTMTAIAPGAAHARTLECVYLNQPESADSAVRDYTAIWGYNNTTGAEQTIPVGPDNKFTPGLPAAAIDPAQPTVFKPGRRYNVVKTTLNGSALVWSLKYPGMNNGTGTASSNSAQDCRTDVEITSAPAATTTATGATIALRSNAELVGGTTSCTLDGAPVSCGTPAVIADDADPRNGWTTFAAALTGLAPGDHTFTVTGVNIHEENDGVNVDRARDTQSVTWTVEAPPAQPEPEPTAGGTPTDGGLPTRGGMPATGAVAESVVVAPSSGVASSSAGAAILPARRCLSVRDFTIRIRNTIKVRRATVRVDGKVVGVSYGNRVRARVNLKGKPKRTVTVKIRVLTRDGKVVTGKRVYRTCTVKLPGGIPKV